MQVPSPSLQLPASLIFSPPTNAQSTAQFLPGQWVDLLIPTLPQAGGFTITSSPSCAIPTSQKPGYVELAIQKSLRNPPAAWLWRPELEILGTDLGIRIGGSFVWPPPGVVGGIGRAVFVAGGVGIKYVRHRRSFPGAAMGRHCKMMLTTVPLVH